MKTITKILDIVLKNALIVLMVALVSAVSWQVISRYIRTGVHLGLDVLPKKLTGTSAQILKLFTVSVVMIFAILVLVVGGGSLVMLTWELKQHSAVLGLPISFVYSVIPVSGVLICFYAVALAMQEEVTEAEDLAQPGS
jgi:TRAP-type C4-dicarboxylate transport system permease small subunit